MARKPANHSGPAAEEEGVRGIEVPGTAAAASDDPRGELVETIEVSDEDAARILAAMGDQDGEAGLQGRVIMVRSVRPEGRRRAGLAFGPEPIPVSCDDLSPEQLRALGEDPDLIVSLDD